MDNVYSVGASIQEIYTKEFWDWFSPLHLSCSLSRRGGHTTGTFFSRDFGKQKGRGTHKAWSSCWRIMGQEFGRGPRVEPGTVALLTPFLQCPRLLGSIEFLDASAER